MLLFLCVGRISDDGSVHDCLNEHIAVFLLVIEKLR